MERDEKINNLMIQFLLGNNSKAVIQAVALTAYERGAAAAYANFLKFGRGFLFGPLASQTGGEILNGDELRVLWKSGGAVLIGFLWRPAADLVTFVEPEHIQ